MASAAHGERGAMASAAPIASAALRLAAYASLSKRRIDLELAQETLGAAITRPRDIITVDSVIKAVASYYGAQDGERGAWRARRHGERGAWRARR